MKLSEITFSVACNETGTDYVWVPSGFDSKQQVTSEQYFEQRKKSLISSFGDVEIRIEDKKLVIIDEEYEREKDEYLNKVQGWCRKHGCE